MLQTEINCDQLTTYLQYKWGYTTALKDRTVVLLVPCAVLPYLQANMNGLQKNITNA